MTTPEGKVKDRIDKVLKLYGAYWFKPVQTGIGTRTLDYICCYVGNFFAIEAKSGALHMTDNQRMIAQSMRKAGAKVFEINEDTGVAELEAWLRSVKPTAEWKG